MVFQHFNVFPNMTVLENVTLAPVLEKKVPKEQAREEAMALLRRVGLGDRAERLSPQALRRAEAAAGHCPGAGDEAGGHAL